MHPYSRSLYARSEYSAAFHVCKRRIPYRLAARIAQRVPQRIMVNIPIE